MKLVWSIFCFDLSRAFLHGTTTPPTPYKSGMNLITGFVGYDRLWMRCYDGISSGALCFDLSRVFLQGAARHHYTIFLELSFFGKGILCFCFDLAKVFLQDATTPPLAPNYFLNCHYLEKWALYVCFDLAKVFLQGATTQPLHHFFKFSLFWEVDIRYLSAST